MTVRSPVGSLVKAPAGVCCAVWCALSIAHMGALAGPPVEPKPLVPMSPAGCGLTKQVADFESPAPLPLEGAGSSQKAGPIFRTVEVATASPCGAKKKHGGERVSIQFEGGDASHRNAAIGIPPVGSGSSRALAFTLRSGYIPNASGAVSKGRVQLNMYGMPGARELRARVRFLLAPGFELLTEYPDSFAWLTLSEWWNNASWKKGEDHPFRISLNLVKPDKQAGSPLRFAVKADVYDRASRRWNAQGLMQAVNTDLDVPMGQWATLDYRIVEGDGEQGLFSLDLTVGEGPPVKVFRLKGFTHHPDDPSPDGFTEINPIKLYTSKRLLDFLQSKGAELTVWWDDLEVTALPKAE